MQLLILVRLKDTNQRIWVLGNLWTDHDYYIIYGTDKHIQHSDCNIIKTKRVLDSELFIECYYDCEDEPTQQELLNRIQSLEKTINKMSQQLVTMNHTIDSLIKQKEDIREPNRGGWRNPFEGFTPTPSAWPLR